MIFNCVCGRHRDIKKILFVLLLSTTALLITLTISKTDLVKVHSDGILANNVQNIKTNFIFPEVNETQVLENQGNNMGQVRTLYMKRSDNRNDSTNDSDVLVFQTSLSFDERQAVLLLFQKFVRACLEFNVTFFLYGGTLLGSLRHHDIIPWDDDIDIMANTSDRALLRQALLSIGGDYGLHCPDGKRWKFYWTKPKTLLHQRFRWPFIDIFFFLENTTHIYDESLAYRNAFSYPKHDIFPLCLRPFAGSLLPVPHQSTKVIHHNYSPSLCSSLSYSHKMERSMPARLRVRIPCTRLYGLHPFVHNHVTGRLVHEQLLLKNTILSTFTVPENCS